MIFSYNWLKEYIKKLPSPEKLAELLTMHSFEVEEVKKTGKDFVLNIDILPNRAADCFSHWGIAREISAILNVKSQIPEVKITENKRIKAKNFIAIENKNRNACQRYTARVMTNVKVSSSPQWLKERLKVCGLQSINNIVDIANYVMLETGQPLHVFDREKLEGNKIIVRFAKTGEKFVSLDDEKYDLDGDILVIADAKKPVAIAGIKGGKGPGITSKTKNIVIESANFDSQLIRKGSRKTGLRTDASLRFEHGIDPNLTETAINRVVYLIQKISNGEIAAGLVDVYPKKVFPKTIKLNLDYLRSLLGIEIKEKEVKDILKRLGFQVFGSKNLTVKVPTRRMDVSIPEDLIEEVGRIVGFYKITSVFPISSLVPPKRNLDIFWEDMTKNILKEGGFTEVYNYSFFGDGEAKLFGYNKKELIELENPVNEEQKYLRASLIPNLLKDVEKNFRQFKEIKIFELGKTFRKTKTLEEKRMLTGLVSGDSFYELKGAVDLLLNKLGISDIFYDQYQATPEESKYSVWYPQKSAEIKVGGEEIGFLGEISSKVVENFKIKGKVVLFDIDFEKLQKLCSEETIYQPVSRYPAAVRDLAVLVPHQTRVEEVLNKIETVGGKLVSDIDLFDIYEGEEIPGGKKNLAFHIIFQAEDRTLFSKEIEELQNKIIKALEENPEWEVRK